MTFSGEKTEDVMHNLLQVIPAQNCSRISTLVSRRAIKPGLPSCLPNGSWCYSVSIRTSQRQLVRLTKCLWLFLRLDFQLTLKQHIWLKCYPWLWEAGLSWLGKALFDLFLQWREPWTTVSTRFLKSCYGVPSRLAPWPLGGTCQNLNLKVSICLHVSLF